MGFVFFIPHFLGFCAIKSEVKEGLTLKSDHETSFIKELVYYVISQIRRESRAACIRIDL